MEAKAVGNFLNYTRRFGRLEQADEKGGGGEFKVITGSSSADIKANRILLGDKEIANKNEIFFLILNYEYNNTISKEISHWHLNDLSICDSCKGPVSFGKALSYHTLPIQTDT
jgi:hypothetical protein